VGFDREEVGRRVEGGGWKMEGGRWKVEGGRWKEEGGRWKVDAGGGGWMEEVTLAGSRRCGIISSTPSSGQAC
jgi:hypothetical protein